MKSRLEKIAGKGKVYVLGLGNTDRADDGAGILVAESLKKHFPSNSFSEHDGVEGIVLDISEKKEISTILFVDAADLRLDPGSIVVVSKEDIREREITTHRVAVALLASLLKSNGKDSAVICIQPATIQFRGEISEPVAGAVNKLVRLLEEIMETRNRR
ncbi:MAG: hypothetical protein A3K60_04660 [Euryarchaeota archaeon RBG_19FT_COMBO_56_21]|nr:MAG: hypothetical protein A3K60_04660 [Euryarchaeota archaeon RBG_19FT_COMBO_56_21]